MFENRGLRRIFGRKKNEVTREWKKKLHNEELNDLYLMTFYRFLHFLCNLSCFMAVRIHILFVWAVALYYSK